MSTQVTLTLPDEVYRRAERLAQLSSRDVADVLEHRFSNKDLGENCSWLIVHRSLRTAMNDEL